MFKLDWNYEQGMDYWNGRIFSNELSDKVVETDIHGFGKYVASRYNEDKKTIEEKIGFTFLSKEIARWDEKDKYFRFADLQFLDLELDNGKVRIDINPCIGEASTKVFIIPMRAVKKKEIYNCKSIFAEFYINSKKISNRIMECITGKYFSYLEEWVKTKDSKIKLDGQKEYYSLYCHIKSLCFDKSKELELKEVVDDIIGGRPVVPQQTYGFLESQIKLNHLIGKKWDFNDYDIFAQVSHKAEFQEKYNVPHGLFGFAGDNAIGHLVGLTTCYPHILTLDIILDVVKNI